MQTCAERARSGRLKDNLGECVCMDTPEDMPQLADYVRRYCSGPKPFEGMIAEEAALLGKTGDWPSQTEQEMTSAARPFGAMPVTVLTNGYGWGYTANADLNARLTMVWRAGQVALAGQSERGKLVVVQNSGHSVGL